MTLFEEFLQNISTPNFKVLCGNIFSMRDRGTKAHGDSAEVGIVKFVNQYLSDNYNAVHVGKKFFRSKKHEEDIIITKNSTGEKIPISIKAYGDGPLQLSTDKEAEVFPYLEKLNVSEVTDINEIKNILNNNVFDEIKQMNVLPLIYNEKNMKYNILVFNVTKALNSVKKIKLIKSTKLDNNKYIKGRKHPIYEFLDDNNEYIFEVRYGGKSANALQRGVWTNTKKSKKYFNSVTNGWVKYNTNKELLDCIGELLLISEENLKKFKIREQLQHIINDDNKKTLQ